MLVVFCSNYMNVHQEPFCREMLELLGDGNFFFVAETPFNSLRKGVGYEDMNERSFVIKAYESDELMGVAEELVRIADVAVLMYKSCFTNLRCRTGKLTFIYTERLLKQSLLIRFHPLKIHRVYSNITRYKSDKLHVLCAGAFVSKDLSYFGFPSSNCWKWGYFPRSESSGQNCQKKERNLPMRCLWVGRMLDWKRPMLALRLADELIRQGHNISLRMVGDGPEYGRVEDYISRRSLDRHVKLYGGLPNHQVHSLMDDSDVFLFTSTRQEGWGSVLSEAMGHGCVPVACSTIGSAPFLIEHGKNGLLFRENSLSSLLESVSELIDNPCDLEGMSIRAKHTIDSEWNPKVAAIRFIVLSDALLRDALIHFDSGPCSPAEIIKDSFF